MSHRAVSPAASENDFDIGDALFGAESDPGLESGAEISAQLKGKELDATRIFDDAEHNSELDDGGDEAFIALRQAESNRKSSNVKGRSVKKGGGFQAMGLNASLLKAITRKGFSVPTPIQRKTIPPLLDGVDVVGMARTGSGKTAAFVIPMIEKLKGHSPKVGSRALILSPSRELALQTLKVVKELGRGTDLRCILLVGGDSLEEQFASMTSNPDVIIATPGRFLHLKVEMGLDLSSIRYVVFDEADRLFEMGFAAQLSEILHALPSSRQTLLFSATLPKSLVEFAKAGLQDPTLIRLDAESKISPDLQNAFFSVKSADKEGALLHILHDIIKISTGQTEAAVKVKTMENPSKKRKRGEERIWRNPNEPSSQHSTIVFAATKHHVEYLVHLLRLSGFAVSYVYGSLDQTARKAQVQDFRTGMTHILVVTDVAARGIDIPILANVINYDFPSQPKVFVHRVGRTARAGQKGWSYSLVPAADAPYLLDLQLFLGRRLIMGRENGPASNFADDITVGGMAQDLLERSVEWVTKILDEDADLSALRSVTLKGEKLYLRTRNAASTESAKRSKEVVASEQWASLHPLYGENINQMQAEKEKMLAKVGGFRPQETIFEIGKRGKDQDETIDAMRKARRAFAAKKEKQRVRELQTQEQEESPDVNGPLNSKDEPGEREDSDMSIASEAELEVTFSQPHSKRQKAEGWKDPENFISYTPANHNMEEDRAYGVQSGSNSNFAAAARGATMDLGTDESAAKGFGEARGIMRWDKRQKKYVSRRNDEDGSRKDSAKMVKGESGRKVAASFRSGRFDSWKKSNRISKLPRVGEKEWAGAANVQVLSGRRYKHKQEKAPREADKFRDDYEKRKQKVATAKEKRIGRFEDGRRQGKKEIKGIDDIRKNRRLKEKRREKNARPSKRK